MSTTTTFTASGLYTNIYDKDRAYSANEAGQGMFREYDPDPDIMHYVGRDLVGIISIPSLSNVDWSDKEIVSATFNVTAYDDYLDDEDRILYLWRSKKSNYEILKGSDYVDTAGGSIEIDCGAKTAYVDWNESIALSNTDIAWLLTQLKAGYTWFCIYNDVYGYEETVHIKQLSLEIKYKNEGEPDGGLRIMTANGTLEPVTLHVMTASGLKDCTVYKMYSDGLHLIE